MTPSEALNIARQSYDDSTSYVDANYRRQWEDGLRMFQGRHPRDSKYNADAYKYRSRLFRPKTRSVIRRHEAIAASAFFSNIDVLSITATDESNPMQLASAEINKELLQYRLTKTIPWFQIVVGAMQDAATVGVVASYQHWQYREKRGPKELQITSYDESGMPIGEYVQSVKVLEDKPCVQLLPVETLRIDPGANWLDPINSSPYLIRMVPMYVQDVRGMMEQNDPKTGQPKWKKYSDGEIRSAVKQKDDETRQAREQKREDSKDQGALKEFEIVWAHENFVRWKGEEMHFWTLGTDLLLTDPRPLEEVYFHGERPVTMGCVIIETHKVYPSGISTLGKDLQSEANEIVNQRLDNVKLVLNKKYLVKRGQNVDMEALQRNVPGQGVMVNSPESDVKELVWPDVTASSFQEQDRVNVDFDELLGNFSQGTVQTNRKMGETVGGMQMVSGAANMMAEYDVRVFAETWVEPTLRQLVKLEQHYETDEVVLALAGQRAQLYQRFGIDQVTDELLMQELTLTVNVGMGATDPNARLGRFVGALQTYANVAAAGRPEINLPEVGKELFALSGYKEGKRFLGEGGPDPMMVQQIQAEMMQQLQPQLEAADAALGEADQAKKEAEKERIAHQDTQLKLIESNARNDLLQAEHKLAQERVDLLLDKIAFEAEKQVDGIKRKADEQVQAEKDKMSAKEEKESEASDKAESKGEKSPAMPPINVYVGGQNKKMSIKAPSGEMYEGAIEATD